MLHIVKQIKKTYWRLKNVLNFLLGEDSEFSKQGLENEFTRLGARADMHRLWKADTLPYNPPWQADWVGYMLRLYLVL